MDWNVMVWKSLYENADPQNVTQSVRIQDSSRFSVLTTQIKKSRRPRPKSRIQLSSDALDLAPFSI